MTQNLFIDLETYSTIDVKKVGVYRYSEDLNFQVLMAAYAIGNGPVRIAVGEDAIRAIPGLDNPEIIKIAHNANFDRVCLSRLLAMPTGTYLDPAQWHDPMAVAGELGYPQKLEYLAKQLGGEQKDSAGTRLINLFCKPARDGHRVLPEERPDDWADFVSYCMQDVATLQNVHEKLGGFPTEMERRIWVTDQRINDRGIRVDTELADAAVLVADDNRMLAELEISTLTGVSNPGSQPQMMRWLKGTGLEIADLQVETIDALLLTPDLDPVVRKVLELRQELALVAAKKYTAAIEAVSEDGRLRGGFRFFGAHTGRWTSGGVQLHNLPRASLDSELAVDSAVLDLKMGEGAEPYVLKALVRAMFTGPFTVVDYAAIEARVIAWLAGEGWALTAFNGGRDIYVETAQRMGGLTRAQGKVAVLALGYNGGIGSLRVMGAEGTDEELQKLVDQWRWANPSIVNFWRQMGNAFKDGGAVGEYITVERDGDSRYLRLPSGRAIAYHGVKFNHMETMYGLKLTPTFLDPKKNNARVTTYGGKLSENVTQAVARDIIAEALVRLDKAGYGIVGHVHDEVLVEGIGTQSVETVSKIMNISPAWAEGLPIGSEGFQCYRYRKG